MAAKHEIAPYGFGTSRVLQTLKNGALPITNDIVFSQECFSSLLPSYTNPAELYDKLAYFLSDENERQTIVTKLQSYLISNFSRRKQAHYAMKAIRQTIESCGAEQNMRGRYKPTENLYISAIRRPSTLPEQ